jgi:phospholipid transport system substrate-binding protein
MGLAHGPLVALALWGATPGAAAPAAAAAAPKTSLDPVATIREAERRLRGALDGGGGRAAVAALSLDYLDYEDLARRSLGKHWARQKPADRAALVKALRALLEETYLPRLQPGASYAFEATLVRRAGGDAEVRAKASGNGQEVPLEFRMWRGQDGHWRVYDATVVGLALLEGYQEQFPQLIELGGMKRLLAQLEDERRAAQVKNEGRAKATATPSPTAPPAPAPAPTTPR